LLRDQLGIREVIFVIGYLGVKIRQALDGKELGVTIEFVEQKEQKGIGNALLMVENHVAARRFAVILGDELYIGSDHRKLLAYLDQEYDAALTFRCEKNRAKISRNFTGEISRNRVLSLTEKPKDPNTILMGLGSYLLTPKVFDYVRSTLASELRGEVEITDVLSNLAAEGNVHACMLNGHYVNVTSTDDINYANYIIWCCVRLLNRHYGAVKH
jgi:glucose-1-phosphate thymidylyltransferase